MDYRNTKKTGFVYIFLAFGIGTFALIFSDKLWQAFGITEIEIRQGLTLSSSLFVLLSGFLLSLMSILGNLNDSITSTRVNVVKDLESRIPKLKALNSYNSKDAIFEIIKKLKDAKVILNTKFIHPDFSKFPYNEKLIPFSAEFEKAIVNGATGRDITSSLLGIKSCETLYSKIKKRKTVNGSYDARILSPTKTMIDFICIKSKNGDEEVWFGWLLSPGSGLEQIAFRTREADLVLMFKNWHQELFRSGNKIEKSS
jgi:hypothetical protein